MKKLLLALTLLVTPVAAADMQLIVLARGSFADQPLTDRRIEALGGAADAWDSPATESFAVLALKELSDNWAFGVQVAYGRASFRRGSQDVTLPQPNRTYYFDQQSDLFDAMVVGRRSLCATCTRFAPFVLAGAGMAHTSGSALIEQQGPGLPAQYMYMRYESEGWFPVANAAVGVRAPLDSTARWSLEFGAGYQWGSFSQEVQTQGPLHFPGEPSGSTITAETSVTGPSLWVGVGRRF